MSTEFCPLLAQVLECIQRNILKNGIKQFAKVQLLDWNKLNSAPQVQRGRWQVVIAADVLYASVLVQPFIKTLQEVLHETGEQ